MLWRRLAPRIVRLIHVDGEDSAPDYLLRGLGDAQAAFPRWPAAEQAAATAACAALLPVALLRWQRPESVLRLLGGLAYAGGELTPWLRRLEDEGVVDAILWSSGAGSKGSGKFGLGVALIAGQPDPNVPLVDRSLVAQPEDRGGLAVAGQGGVDVAEL